MVIMYVNACLSIPESEGAACECSQDEDRTIHLAVKTCIITYSTSLSYYCRPILFQP